MSHAFSTRVLVGALTVLGIVIGACAPAATGPTGETPGGAAQTAQPKRGGDLRFLLQRDSTTGYDPALTTESTVFTIDQMIFDTLAEIQPDGSLKPSLAEEWQISADQKTYTFKIRTGVKFHNGREMTAADVKYTIDRMRNPDVRSPRRTIYAPVESVEAPNATTVVIKVKDAFAPLVYALADVTASIVPKEVVEAQGNLQDRPIGTGPFKFVERVRDQFVKVERNPDYWRSGLPYLDRITFSFNGDPNASAAGIRSANVDFLWNALPELYEVLKADRSLNIYGGEGTTTFQWLLLNVQKKPFDDVRVRQAISWALDREQIRQISRPTTTTVLNSGFLPPTHWAGVPQSQWIYKQDLAKAKQLLAAAGYPNGFDMTIIPGAGSPFHVRSSEAIQQQLKELKINVRITVMDGVQMTSARDAGNFEGLIGGFTGTNDPDERFQQSFVTGGATNSAKFSDAKIDELAAAARRTSNREERAKLYREAQLRLADIGPMIFTYNYHFYDVLQSYVKGYTFNPQLVDYRSVREVWLDK